MFWQTFFLRGLLSPFAHVSFTALCGLGLGIAAERRSLMLYFGLGVGGLSLGMVLHALWNGSTFFLPVDPEAPLAGFLRYYVTVQVPIFVLLVAIVLFLRLREKRILRRQLSEYGRAGWFSPDEVEMLVSMRGRRRAEAGRCGTARWRAWHAPSDPLRGRAGMERHGVLFGKPTAKTRARERELLEMITADRRLIGALTTPSCAAEPRPSCALVQVRPDQPLDGAAIGRRTAAESGGERWPGIPSGRPRSTRRLPSMPSGASCSPSWSRTSRSRRAWAAPTRPATPLSSTRSRRRRRPRSPTTTSTAPSSAAAGSTAGASTTRR